MDLPAWSSSRAVQGLAARPGPVRAVLLSLVLLLVIKTAWVGDDAFITLRTAENLLHGHGLNWNVDERIQSFTHPLWLFVLAGLHAVIGHGYATLVTAGIVTTTAACGLFFWRVSASPVQAVLACGALAFSKYFVDYATSGLANPLLYLLVAWFTLAWFRLRDETEGPGGWRVFWLVFVAALCGLTRLDSLLLVGPPLLVALHGAGWRAHWRSMLAGTLPLVAWEIFAVVYYGSPVPNSAYAKLNTGIPAGELAIQGLRYCWHTLRTDPLLILVLGTAVVLSFTRSRSGPGEWSFGVGFLLVVAYIVRVGGDFMAGRFFTVPFFLALCLLVRRPPPGPRATGAAALVLLAALAVPRNSVTCAWNLEFSPDFHGILDERAYYYRWTGLLPRFRPDFVEHEGVEKGREMREFLAERESGVGAGKMAGMMPYYSGPKLHFVDRFGLCNAFLARLPADRTRFEGGWRIGHFYRHFPEGYYESVATPENLLTDPELAELYDQVQLVTTGPLFSAQRWRAIWALNVRGLTGRGAKP